MTKQTYLEKRYIIMIFVTLKKMPYAQAKVQILETGENFRCNLVSYTTCVAHIIEGGWLIVNGLYSRSSVSSLIIVIAT